MTSKESYLVDIIVDLKRKICRQSIRIEESEKSNQILSDGIKKYWKLTHLLFNHVLPDNNSKEAIARLERDSPEMFELLLRFCFNRRLYHYETLLDYAREKKYILKVGEEEQLFLSNIPFNHQKNE